MRSSEIFDRRESNVQSYARNFPTIFHKAKGSVIWDQKGEKYIDFLAGAGSLNYGHNNEYCKHALLNYISDEGITHGLDLHTEAKANFLASLENLIFKPRKMDYVVQFTGPTGTNAVEAALKIARRVSGRTNVVCFTNGFHGVSIGSLAATGHQYFRDASGLPLFGVTRMPFCNYFGKDIDTLGIFKQFLDDPSSGLDKPAAVLIETLQGEGGLNEATKEWVVGLSKLCKEYDMLLIVDDIQAGCGRTGHFFSFDTFDVEPDIVVLSKSLSGYGLPLSVVLLKRELDCWKPGEHNGTFRGNNHAFITATAVLNHYWETSDFVDEIATKSDYIDQRLRAIQDKFSLHFVDVRGRGMMKGIKCKDPKRAAAITHRAFEKRLIMERCGPFDEVVKCMMPLTIEDHLLEKGLDILEQSITDEFDLKHTIPTSPCSKQESSKPSIGVDHAA